MSSGPTRASSRANGHGDERPRVSGPSSNLRSERPDAYRKAPSPQPTSQYASTTHKRTASGNPRPTSLTATTTEDRRYEERRVTERTYEAHIQRLVPRSSGSDKEMRGASRERKAQESQKQKQPEPRSRAADTSQGKQAVRDAALSVPPRRHHGLIRFARCMES